MATPAAVTALAAWRGLGRQAAEEWRATPFGWGALRGQPPRSLSTQPKDFRPVELETGRAILAGNFTLAGAVLPHGPGGDPWDTPSPTRLFAVELHRFGWLPALVALGEAGERDALRLMLDWEALFGRPTAFPWRAEVLERRVYNWTCALGLLLTRASDAESGRLLAALARQARWLLALDDGSFRAAERLAAAATGAAALEPRVGAKPLATALERLGPALKMTVLADGGHRSRSPQAGLELLFDLLTLDDALHQAGRAGPTELSRSIDRLTSAARFFTLGDGALAAFQGGESVEPARVRAARIRDEGDAAPAFAFAPHAGYQRLSGRRLHALVDAGAPAADGWGLAACAQPCALEISAGRDRLIVNTGWSPDAADGATLRLSAAGSTVTLGDASPGAPLGGWRAAALGPRLVGAPTAVTVRRNEDDADNVWIELSHAGWVAAFGHVHERRLYLDSAADELRGEDRLTPRPGEGRAVAYAVRFHLHPDVSASAALDGRSVMLRGPTSGGWRLRHDAGSATVEPSALLTDGLPRRSTQIVLRGDVRPEIGARIRWKLSPVDAGG